MKRVKESGASYRNKRRAKLEIAKKDEGALLKYVKVPVNETLDSTPNSNAQAQEQLETAEELDIIHLDSEQNVRIASENPTPSTSSQAMNLNILETATKMALPGFQHGTLNDIGKWPVIIDEDMRLHLIQQGHEIIQNINSDFVEASRSVSSTSTLKGETRRLSKEWFYRRLTNGEKVLRTWMAYSPSKASLFCVCCRLFEDVRSSTGSKFCSSEGFSSWWK